MSFFSNNKAAIAVTVTAPFLVTGGAILAVTYFPALAFGFSMLAVAGAAFAASFAFFAISSALITGLVNWINTPKAVKPVQTTEVAKTDAPATSNAADALQNAPVAQMTADDLSDDLSDEDEDEDELVNDTAETQAPVPTTYLSFFKQRVGEAYNAAGDAYNAATSYFTA